MSDKSGIPYVDASWPIVAGCTKTSPGCENCWAIPTAWRLAHNPNPKVSSAAAGTVEKRAGGNLAWTGLVRCLPERLEWPLRWKTARRIFVSSQADLFHDDVPEGFIADVFGVMAAAPWHTYLVLTKRSDRALALLASGCMGRFESAVADCLANYSDAHLTMPLPHVFIGATVEDQAAADARLPAMEGIARFGWNTWVSYEPALGPVDWSPWVRFIRWAVAGGESGRGARPMHPDYPRALREWCAAAGVAFNFKQWGEWHPVFFRDEDGDIGVTPAGQLDPVPAAKATHHFGDCEMERIGKHCAGRLLDGRLHDALPSTLHPPTPNLRSAKP